MSRTAMMFQSSCRSAKRNTTLLIMTRLKTPQSTIIDNDDMHIYDSRKILDLVTILKEIKTSSFSCKDGLVDLHNVTETCRIIDTLLLPLYYIWEYCCHQQLKDINFEEHLSKPYQKFIQNPITYTWELYLFITLKEPIPRQLTKKRVCKEISNVYKELIDDYKMTDNAIPRG